MKRFHLTVAIFTFTRIVLNTAHRMVYPYLGVFRDGLGISLSTLSVILTIKSLVGASGPLLATIADSKGRKTGMLLGLMIFTIGALLVVIWPTLTIFIAAIMLTVLGKYIFDPSMHAYLGDRVAYKNRGRVMAISEYSWSLSFIFGVPVVGYLIKRFSWIGPFPYFAILGSILILTLFFILPKTEPRITISSNIWGNLLTVLNHRLAMVGLVMSTFLSMANEIFNLVFGIWLEDSFGLRIIALGIATLIIGLSEFGGESLVAIFVDRIGKARSVATGVVLNSLIAIGLPFITKSVIGAMLGLVIFYITFEFALVSSIPLMSEVVPSARATMIGSNAAAHSLGRAAGALVAAPLYALGIQANTHAVVLCNSIGLIALIWLIRNSETHL